MREPGTSRVSGALLALLSAAFASAAWFLASERLLRRYGPDGASIAIALLVAAAVSVALWRWARVDAERIALAGGRCPRCEASLEPRHEHARSGALAGGLYAWECERCGFRRAEALTCSHCET